MHACMIELYIEKAEWLNINILSEGVEILDTI